MQDVSANFMYCNCFPPKVTVGERKISLIPNNTEVDAGREVVCTCYNDVTTESPAWEINNVPYLACDLPFGYKANGMNLTFVAYETSSIRCGYLVYNDGKYLPIYSEISTFTVQPKGYYYLMFFQKMQSIIVIL